jgi:hypothetical protein
MLKCYLYFLTAFTLAKPDSLGVQCPWAAINGGLITTYKQQFFAKKSIFVAF